MATLNLKTPKQVRVYADIDFEVEQQLRMRCIQYETQTGERMTRKNYLEKLIKDDAALIAGNAAKVVKPAKQTSRK